MRADVVVVECTDWRQWRALRLEALADTPIGFGDTLAAALARPDEEWAAHWTRPGLRLIAYDGDDPVGMAGGFLADDGTRVLFGVYVRPAARGKGVLDALVERVRAWAAPSPLHLHVHVDNAPARAKYERTGWTYDGRVTPGGGIDGGDLLGMVLPLQAEGGTG